MMSLLNPIALKSEEQRQYFHQIHNALKNATVTGYQILGVLEDDHMLMFDILLSTNVGTVKALNVEHIHIDDESVVEAFKQVFQPGFGELLKQDIINDIEHKLEMGYAPHVSVVQ